MKGTKEEWEELTQLRKDLIDLRNNALSGDEESKKALAVARERCDELELKLLDTPEENIVNEFTGRKVLFIENDMTLDDGVDTFKEILDRNGIESTVILEASQKEPTDVIEAVKSHDVMVFQTQWMSHLSNALLQFMLTLRDKKSVVEVFINEPTWLYQRADAIHDMYIFTHDSLFKNTEFYRLSKDVYYKHFVNRFDR